MSFLRTLPKDGDKANGRTTSKTPNRFNGGLSLDESKGRKRVEPKYTKQVKSEIRKEAETAVHKEVENRDGIGAEASLDFASPLQNVRPNFNRFGQHEPATVRIRNIITQYVGDRDGCGIEELIKELMQNSDDAGSTEIHFILDQRRLSTERVWTEWNDMQGPALCVHNDSIFTQDDIVSIQRLGVGSKSTDPDKTGQFGIGFNVVYQLTDCPVLLSDHRDVCMFDPHLRYVPGACDERPGGHIDLKQDVNFAKLFPDFMTGFLRGLVEHSGCTVFRFPLRQPSVESAICDMTFGDADVEAIAAAFQSVDFRMFLHSTLIFAKHLNHVKVSMIEASGELQEKVKVRRIIPKIKSDQLRNAHQHLLRDIREVMVGKLPIHKVDTTSISYHLQTVDEYLKNDWFVNQSFGFHGSLTPDAIKNLETFYKEHNKKFLPVAGVAGKVNCSNMLISLLYSFLPMPIHTGLPAHINGHFAIHSSRRTIWEHTSFGQWNKLLSEFCLAPCYCHYLRDFAQSVNSADKMKTWIKMLPEMSHVKTDFVSTLTRQIYIHIVQRDTKTFPVLNQKRLYGLRSSSECIFVTSVREEAVEKLLMNLGLNIITNVEISLRFTQADVKGLILLTPMVLLQKLKTIQMKLPQQISDSEFRSIDNLTKVLAFIFQDKSINNFKQLEKLPLCLTSDGQLRSFSLAQPVFIDSQYAALVPTKPQTFLHPNISYHFERLKSSSCSGSSPLQVLSFSHIGEMLTDFQPSKSWLQLMWKFIKENTNRDLAKLQLEPLSHLSLIPTSDGQFITLTQALTVISAAEASLNMNKVIEKLEILRLDASRVASDQVSAKDIQSLATPLMLNAALPRCLIAALKANSFKQDQLKPEDCETILQYLSLDTACVHKDVDSLRTVKSLAIFEDIDGNYKMIGGSNGVVLDNCIPTHGTSTWMEQSNCVLLKEKSAYADLYISLGLVKKHAIDVYLDDIFPNFSSFTEELRMSHLTSIRTAVVPLLDAYADDTAKERFWSRLRRLPFIPSRDDLLPPSRFRDPAHEVLTLLNDVLPLPLRFSDDHWLDFLRKAGLKSDLSEEELLACAAKVTTLTTAEFAEEKARLVLDTVGQKEYSKEILEKLSKIKFIAPDAVPIDDELAAQCRGVAPPEQYICLRGALRYEHDKHRHIFRHSVLCWTVRMILPKWALDLPSQLAEIADVSEQPSISDVCQHIINLSERLPATPLSSTFKSFRKVISYCLDYLQNPCRCLKKKCLDCAALRSLRNVPFVCVKARHMRVKPSQVVLSLPSDVDGDLLYPYVFARPPDMARYDELLRHVGALPAPTADIYADMLHSLWLDFGGTEPLQTNDKQTASLAVYGLFTALQQPGQRLTTRPLCLPSDKAMMTLSTELVIADNESLSKSLRDHDYQFMCSLSSCNLNKTAKELIFYIPDSIRPKLLSELITEQVRVDTPCDLDLSCPFYKSYYDRVHSSKFKEALWLLVKIPEERRESFSHELGRLKLLEVTCFHTMYSYMSEGGRTLENSQIEKEVHVSNTLASARLYVKHHDAFPGSTGLVTQVACAIKSVICYNENFYIDIASLVELLRCRDDKQIADYLVDQGLSYKQDDMSRPAPGAIIPPESRELFTYDPDLIFQPKEYVAFINKHRQDEMVYARVLRESGSTEGQEVKPMLRDYDIDIGQGYPISAGATDLCKESRRLNLDQQRRVVMSDRSSTGSRRQSSAIIEEAKRTVSRLLEEVYSDVTLWRHRDKVRKRLLLKWHPDKAGNSDLVLEVFKHLRREIDRVEEKYTLSDDEDEEEREEVYEWEEVELVEIPADKKIDQEQKTVLKGDLELAKLWLDQAERDVKMAQSILDVNPDKFGHEWTCNICCEAVRKSLVAMIAAKMPVTSDLESTRFTNKLFEMINRLADPPAELPVQLLTLHKLKVDEMTTRQPGMHTKLLNPHQVFTRDTGQQVLQATRDIYTSAADLVNDACSEQIDEHNEEES